MPVPKRKRSRARRDSRHSTRFIRPQAVAECGNCSKPLSSHTACGECGFYKGAKVLRTKVERILKRGEIRRAQEAKSAASKPAVETAGENK